MAAHNPETNSKVTSTPTPKGSGTDDRAAGVDHRADGFEGAVNDDASSSDRRDPRLEIPEILRTPVEHPSLKAKEPSKVATNLGEVGTALAIAIDFLATAGAGALIGWGIDRWRGSLPVGVLIGAAVGFFVGTFRLLVRLNKTG